MQLSSIFDVVEGSLYSVKYKGCSAHELERCFDLWNDPFYLREFFNEHKADFEDEYWRGITIEEAIKKTREDAIQLENTILTLQKQVNLTLRKTSQRCLNHLQEIILKILKEIRRSQKRTLVGYGFTQFELPKISL